MRRSTWRERARQLREDLNAVAVIRSLHPAWQAVIWESALLNGSLGVTENAMQTYRSANGGPDSDTFMACPLDTSGPLTSRVARAVTGAVVAVGLLEQLQSRLTGQLLQSCLQWQKGWLNPQQLDPEEAESAVFVTPRGRFLGRGVARHSEEIGIALCQLLAEGRQPPPRLMQPLDLQRSPVVRAAVAVSLYRQSAPEGRHLHRSAWNSAGGPWLGIGETEELQLISTCHRAIEGFGHALLSQEVMAGVAAKAPLLEERLRQRSPTLTDSRLVPESQPAFPGPRLGWTSRFLTEGAGRFVHQAYAMGRALHIFYAGNRAAGANSGPCFSPTFHVPVAPLTSSGELNRNGLIRHGLLSVRIRDGRFESLEDFEVRLQRWLEVERRGEGLLTRLAVANCTARLPRFFKLRLLRSRRRPSILLPPVEVLAGRGRMSTMRFPRGERPLAPLYAVAAPALFPTPKDSRGGQALTLIHHEAGCTATLVGSGLSGTRTGAEAFLDLWLEELAAASAPGLK